MYLVLTRVETVLLIKRFAVQIVAARSRTPMQVLRVALLVLAAALTEAQAPVFGGQYIGDVRILVPGDCFLTGSMRNSHHRCF